MDHADVLTIARSHPTSSFVDGETVIADGDRDPALYVLASGALDIRPGGRSVAVLHEPGSMVGEIGLLLGTPASAEVLAVGTTVVHRIVDASELFTEHADFGRHLAVVLAGRLRQVTSFLGDIERQFADRTDTLGLVPAVLSELLGGGSDPIEPGSEREPDSPY